MKTAAEALVLAAIYLVIGWIALTIAGPKGFATAIFPAAGIALVALLRFGNRLWPGVFIGDLTVGLLVDDGGTGVAASAGIALGASLQALCGSMLLRRWVRDPQALAEEGDIVRSLVLCGPVSCLVSASVATASLAAAGQVYPECAPITWWTWWVGDTVGVLLGAPLALCVVGEPKAWRQRVWTVGVPLGIALVALSAFFAKAGDWEQQRFRTEFQHRARLLVEALEQGLRADLEMLDGLASFMEGLPEVRREHFYAFLRRQLAHHPGIQALAWAPRVPIDKRAAFEQGMRLSGFPGFQITEHNGSSVSARPRREHFPVTFIEPFLPNGAALGLELASKREALDAIERARSTAAAAATGPHTLVPEAGDSAGMLVVQPVYRRSQTLEPVPPASPELRGLVLAQFRVSDRVDAVYDAGYRKDMSLRILDGPGLLYGSLIDASERHSAALAWSRAIAVADREWTLDLAPTRHYLATHRPWGAWAPSATAPLLSGLLAAFLLAVSGRTTRIQSMVARRTGELEEANRSLRDSEARFRDLADSVPVLIWLADPDGYCTYFNRRWLEFTGRSLAEDLGFGWTEEIHPADREGCLTVYGEAIRTRDAFEIEYRMRRHDGSYRWILDRGGPRFTPDQGFAGFIGTAIDVTARKEAEAEVHHLAYHDALTGLPNRRLLADRLQQALAQAERRQHSLAVLYVDLDNFKPINDTLGHAAGDAVLREIVTRLSECLREEDTVARVGGDEFLIVLPNLPSGDAATPVAQKTLTALATPFFIPPLEVRITVSLGISVYPRDGKDGDTLIRHADTALYRAKKAGRNTYRYFSPEGSGL
jgi:diguanylate cyclase (GGDEF)-like protein/PAS domain S-box-containing protein